MEKNGYASAQEAFDQALVIAQREVDITLEMQTLAGFAIMAQIHLQREEGLEHSLRAIDLAQQANDIHAEVEARISAFGFHYDLGEPQESHRHVSAALAVAERLRELFWLGASPWRSQTPAVTLGDWATARELGIRGMLVDETDPRFLGLSAWLEYEVGNFRLFGPGNQPAPQSSLFLNGAAALLIPIAYRITGTVFRIDYAEAAAHAVLSSPYAMPVYQSVAHLGLGLLAAQRSDAAMAAEQY